MKHWLLRVGYVLGMLLFALASSALTVGCQNDDRPMDDAAEEVEDRGEKADEALDEAGDETEDALEKAGDETEDALEKAREATDDATD